MQEIFLLFYVRFRLHGCLTSPQLENSTKMCSAPPLTVNCPQLVSECEVIKDRFEPLFALFSRCHSLYDSYQPTRIRLATQKRGLYVVIVQLKSLPYQHFTCNTQVSKTLLPGVSHCIYYCENSSSGRPHDTVPAEMEQRWFLAYLGNREPNPYTRISKRDTPTCPIQSSNSAVPILGVPLPSGKPNLFQNGGRRVMNEATMCLQTMLTHTFRGSTLYTGYANILQIYLPEYPR